MKQYRKLFFLGFICAAWPVSYAQAQDVSAGVPDSLLTIGYTVGHTRNISSLVESFTGKQLKASTAYSAIFRCLHPFSLRT